MRHDCRGLAVTTQDAAAVSACDHAVLGILAHRADTAARLTAVLDADPGLALGWCIKGFALMILARAELLADAALCRDRAQQALTLRGGTKREYSLVAALDCWCQGDMIGCAARLDQHVVQEPLDACAIKLQQTVQFMLGGASAMRSTLERILPVWNAETPGAGYILGCYAFTLEETGAYAEAERMGRQAVAYAPDDAWGAHAVAHVMEMQGRVSEGAAWIEAQTVPLAGANNFGFHLHWHHALFHLAAGDPDATLALYDRRVRAEKTDDFRDYTNAASLLWRLEAEGVDVGRRWDELAELALKRGADGTLAFAAAHRGLALAAAGRRSQLDALIRQFDAGAAGAETGQAQVFRRIGLPLLRAISAAAAGEPGRAVDLLFPYRARLQELGGSNAQRDLFIWFLTDAALSAGRWHEASELLAQRSRIHEPADWPRRRLAELPASYAA